MYIYSSMPRVPSDCVVASLGQPMDGTVLEQYQQVEGKIPKVREGDEFVLRGEDGTLTLYKVKVYVRGGIAATTERHRAEREVANERVEDRRVKKYS